MDKRNIVLVGFMGSGKTAIGKEIARHSGLNFVDLDEEIEKRERMAIPEIFKDYGESYFRDVEAIVARAFSKEFGLVISTGGGIVMNDRNIENLKRNGEMYFLNAAVNEIWNNTRGDDSRPLLNIDNPEQVIRELLDKRMPQYQKCDIVIPTKGKSVKELSGEILRIYTQKNKLERLKVDLGKKSYDIVIGEDILECLADEIRKIYTGTAIAIITNTKIKKLYGNKLEEILRGHGFEVTCHAIKDGEAYKNAKTLSGIYDHLMDVSLHRDGLIVALGGGVVGDLAGYAAATFMRGVPFVQVPTTLLAQVDSSVGGKTGINHPKGKNMIGAFHQPKLVFIDTKMLKTLDKKELTCGLAEVIKYGLIRDAKFFKYLARNIRSIRALKEKNIKYVVKRSCEIKAAVVEEDEKEQGLRAILNFGHTLGHALEAATGYKRLTHGQAVAVGMVMALKISERKLYVTQKELQAAKRLIKNAGLPVSLKGIPMEVNRVLSAVKKDKKYRMDKMRFVISRKIGRVEVVENITEEDLKWALTH